MNQLEKTLIKKSLCYTKDPSYWGGVLIKKYIRELNRIDSKIPLSPSTQDTKENVIDWIESGDKLLPTFYEFCKKNEQDRRKTVELLNLPEDIQKRIINNIDNLEEIEYDPFSAGTVRNPKIVYAKKKGNQIEIWLATRFLKLSSIKIASSKLSPTAKKELVKILSHDDFKVDEINDVLCHYNSSQRTINTLVIDLDAKKITAITDEQILIDPDDKDENRIRPDHRFPDILNNGLSIIDKKITTEDVENIREKKRINKDVARKISAKETKDILLLPYKFEFDLQNGDLSEKNTNKFYKYTPNSLKNAVSKFYEETGTFVGFLSKNPMYDAEENGDLLRHIQSVNGVQRIGEAFYIFLLNGNNEMCMGSFTVNILEGYLKTYLEKGGEIHERVSEELDKLFP